MDAVKRRYPKDEFARRGDAAYEMAVLPNVQGNDQGKFAAVDIESGAYEIDADEMKAGDRLRARIPDAQVWTVRIGSRSDHHIGGARRNRP